MATTTRYIDLLNAIVNGPYYDPQGTILPYRSGPTQLRIITTHINTNFLILINNIQSGFTTTDGDGDAIFYVNLPLGEVVLELLRESSTERLVAYVTVRQTAVWHVALAEQYEGIDDSIDSTLNSFYLDKAGPVDIELAHGVPLRYSNETPADLEAYREMLQLVRQSTRQFTGRLSGKFNIIAALTQINPYIFERYKNGPRWVLGYDLLFDNLQNYSKFVNTTALTNINASGQFITLNSVNNYTQIGSGVLTYNKYLKRLKWAPLTGGTVVAPFKYETPYISTNSQYTIPVGRTAAVVDSLYTVPSPVLAQYNHLYIEIDKLGIIDVNLSLNGGLGGIGLLDVDTIVNGFFKSNNTYNSKRITSAQPTGALSDRVEVVKVSDNTDISVSTIGTIDTDTLNARIRYTAPGDVAGVYNDFVSNFTLMRLYSGNATDYIDVVWDGVFGLITDTFIIANRYDNVASFLSPNKLRITSQNIHLIDGNSNVTIHDGGGNAATSPITGSYRGRYDIPKIYTTLSANVITGTTSVQIPSNDIDKFSLSKNNNFPFDIIVGYGYRSTETLFTVTPDSNTHTAVIRIISGPGQFKVGDTYINLYMYNGVIRSTRNNGVHKIIEFISDTSVRVSYGGIGCSQTLITGISIIGVDPKSIYSNGLLSYTFATTQLKWEAPSDISYGPNVTLGSNGYYRLHSNNGEYIDVLVYMPSLPVIDIVDSIFVDRFRFGAAGGTDVMTIWSSGEKASVISVTSGTPDIWNLKDPIIGNYVLGQSVYLRNGQLPLHVVGQDNFYNLSVTANISYEPAAFLPTDTVPVSGSSLPDGWIKTSIFSPIMQARSRFSKYEDGALFIGSGGITTIEKDVPFNKSLCGLSFYVNVYAASIANDGASNSITISVDYGSGFIGVVSDIIADPDDTVRQPQLISGLTIVPSSATKFRLGITLSTVSCSTYLEKVTITQYTKHALFLGHNTIPRNNSRANFSSLMYVWSPDQLSQDELNMLGLTESITLSSGTYNGGAPVDGRIADSINAHEEFDVFDITDVVGGNVVNVRGAITDLDWASTTLTNMEIVARSPRRFSYTKPSIISYQNEELTFTTTPPYKATLSVIGDQNLAYAVLFEDEVPVPQDQYQFNTSTEIQIISGFNASAQYRFEYQALIQVETQPIDIVVPASNGNDTWIADYLVWNRCDVTANVYNTEVALTFDANLRAVLPYRSDSDKLQSVLTENTGITKRIVPQQAWDYIDSISVRLSGAEFNANSVYTFTYNQQIPDVTRMASILAEIRSAASIFSLGTAAYNPFTLISNNFVDASLRYHQIRLTLNNVGRLEDLRVHSATLRGLRLNTGPVAPGL